MRSSISRSPQDFSIKTGTRQGIVRARIVVGPFCQCVFCRSQNLSPACSRALVVGPCFIDTVLRWAGLGRLTFEPLSCSKRRLTRVAGNFLILSNRRDRAQSSDPT